MSATAAEARTEDAYTAGQLTRLFSKTSRPANQDAALVSLFTPAAASADQSEKTVANGNHQGQQPAAAAAAAKKRGLSEADGKGPEQKKAKKMKQNEHEAAPEAEPSVADRSTLKARAKLAKQREQARTADPRNPRTAFVGNVSTSAKKRDLLALFRQHGPIESVRFRSAAPADAGVAKRLAVIHRKLSRQSLNAYIVYKEVESVGKAIDALNGHCLSGLTLRVDCLPGCEGDRKKDESKCIFLGNLHFKCDEESVRAAFAQCGQVTNVRLVRDARSGVGRGFGFVQFADAAAVELALRLAGTEVSGRPVRVSRCSDTVAKKKTEAAAKKMKMKNSDASESKRDRKKKKRNQSEPEHSTGRDGWKKPAGAEDKKRSKNNGGGKGKLAARKTATAAGSAAGKAPPPRPTNRTSAQAFQRMLDKRKGRRSASRAAASAAVAGAAKRNKK